jgi:hypothetical protein
MTAELSILDLFSEFVSLADYHIQFVQSDLEQSRGRAANREHREAVKSDSQTHRL